MVPELPRGSEQPQRRGHAIAQASEVPFEEGSHDAFGRGLGLGPTLLGFDPNEAAVRELLRGHEGAKWPFRSQEGGEKAAESLGSSRRARSCPTPEQGDAQRDRLALTPMHADRG